MMKKQKISTQEFIDIYFDKNNYVHWEPLAHMIDNKYIDVSEVNINDLFNDSDFFGELLYTDDTFKSYLRYTDLSIITKDTFAKLFYYKDIDEEYIDIIKNIVEKTNEFNNMYFYDSSDNGYNREKSKKIIMKEAQKISTNLKEEDLYECSPSALFKYKNFKPNLITNLTSPSRMFDKEYYDDVDYNVIFI